MRVVVLCHSLVSDWNHGNAHFLRGVVSELLDRGHDVRVFEPLDGWSRANLVVDQGRVAVDDVLLLRHPRDSPLEVTTNDVTFAYAIASNHRRRLAASIVPTPHAPHAAKDSA